MSCFEALQGPAPPSKSSTCAWITTTIQNKAIELFPDAIAGGPTGTGLRTHLASLIPVLPAP